MDQDALKSLTILLALGAGFVAPVKAGVDVVKRALPDDAPGWAFLVAALILGESALILVSVYSGLAMTPQNIAGCVLAGAVAAGGAVASTEIHKAARQDTPMPTVAEIADELEARRLERVQARLQMTGGTETINVRMPENVRVAQNTRPTETAV